MNRAFVRLMIYVVRFAGAVAAVWGVAYAINGATQAEGSITVQVSPGPGVVDSLRLTGVELPPGVGFRGADLSLQVWKSTVIEQVVARADVLVSGLCAGVAALLLGPLLASVLDGEPFRRGNPARVAWLAVLVVVSGSAGALPGLASAAVLGRVGLTGTFVVSPALSWVPFVGAAFLSALAVAIGVGRHASPVPGR
ncbi:hypothetical protein ACBJ59_29930 [Nonomuraea sp. MTCD27]|uniref:hypothetical protein n=1 Tax=Nonomuraea sp. MTCD27 TaxID=1676747 RepID=UPI0035BFE26C